jgi:hypothetical protein
MRSATFPDESINAARAVSSTSMMPASASRSLPSSSSRTSYHLIEMWRMCVCVCVCVYARVLFACSMQVLAFKLRNIGLKRALACMYMYMYTLCTCIHTCIYIYMCMYMYIYIYMHTHIYILFAHICAYIYIYMYISYLHVLTLKLCAITCCDDELSSCKCGLLIHVCMHECMSQRHA